VETFFSMLLAPILMMTQTSAVAQILSGRDSDWKTQRRDDGSVPLQFAMRFHASHMAAGAVIALICYIVSPGLLLWMLPVVAGLVLAGPLNWLTGQPAGPVMTALLGTWEDRDPPSILTRAHALSEEWKSRFSQLAAAEAEERGSAVISVSRAA
jgi:membrane glycosyltransferase